MTKFLVFKLRLTILYALLIVLVILLICHSTLSMEAAKKALTLCFQTVIPSLFPFFILSGLLTTGPVISALTTCLSPIMMPLFRTKGVGALPLILGFISGYPMGAKTVAELYRIGAISKNEGQRLSAFANNSGPLFVIGAVGAGMLRSSAQGFFLYAVHILSALLVGFCFRFRTQNIPIANTNHPMPTNSHSLSISEVVTAGVNTMLLVCGFIVFFASINACLTPIWSLLSPKLSLCLLCISEVTGGAKMVTETIADTRVRLSFLSFIVGFGGICVMLQVAGFLKPAGLSLKPYLFGKILQGITAAVLTYVMQPIFFREIVPTFSAGNHTASVAPLQPYIAASLLFFIVCFLWRVKNICRHHAKSIKK